MDQGTPIFLSTLKKKRTLLRILAVAMMVSVVIYTVVAWFLSVQAEADPTAAKSIALRLPLGIVGIVTGLASIAVRIVWVSTERMERRLAGAPDLERAAIHPQTRKLDHELLESFKTMTLPEQKIIGLMTWYQVPYIIMLALSESIALFGLVLAILSRTPSEMLPFAAVSLLLIIRTALHPGIVLDQADSILQRMPRPF